MSTNDKRILDLQKKIDKKEKDLEKAKQRFSPITNCLMQLHGKTYNLHALDKNDIDLLLVTIHSMARAAEELELNPKISGYSLTDWEADLLAKRSNNSVMEQTKVLKAMKDKLHQLLSADKKVEIEIDDIEAALK